MSDRVRWFEHQGLKVLLEDFSNLPEDEFVKAIQEAERLMLESGDKVIYAICKMHGVRMTDAVKKAAQALMDNTKPKGIYIHSTMIGMSTVQRILANAIKRDMYFAKTDEDAKAWLLKQAEKEKVKQPVG